VEDGDAENYQKKPRRHHATPWTGTLLQGSERLATLLDRPGERSATRRATLDVVPSVPGVLGASNLSPGTIQKHVDNVWALGGEFIRDLHNDPSLRRRPVDQVLFKMIEYGGPLLYHGGEDQQRSFDATCRKLRRFLIETAR
jgi:hypothetical protein